MFEDHHIGNLAGLPLFISVRAAIRAMVQAQTALATASPMDEDATLYLTEALAVLSPPEPALVLIGGLSGSGKTTVAQELAPKIGAVPGAVLLRSDTERKAMQGVDTQTPLAAFAYTPRARAIIYDRIIQRAKTILATGHSVFIDATFLDPDDRQTATNITADTGIVVHRFWLEAPLDTLIDRVKARRGDASDADADLVRAQFSSATPPHDWTSISATGSIADTVARIEPELRATGALSRQN